MCMYSRYANSSYAIFYAGKAEGISRLGSAIKNLGLFSKSPGDFKMETMDF